MSGWNDFHVGRSFGEGNHPIEDECPCPKGPCGLVIFSERDPNCAQHAPMKTMRQAHPVDQCPAVATGGKG